MKRILLPLLLCIYSHAGLYAATITSVANGNWFDVTTWSTSSVPGTSDNVIINHQVLLNGTSTVASLTINAGKVLMDDNASRALIVTGTILNNGTLQQNVAGWYFRVYPRGNVINNGVWKPFETILEGSSNQTLSCTNWLEGYWVISDTLGEIQAGGRLMFRNSRITGNNAWIKTNGYTFETFQEELVDLRVFSNDTLLLRQSVGDYTRFYGDVKMGGVFYYRNQVSVTGTLTVLDSIYDDNSSRVITIQGSIINKGLVGQGPSKWYNKILVTGNIHNQGVWNPFETQLIGSGNQQISQGSNNWFEGYFTVTDTIGETILMSRVKLKNSTLFGSGSLLRTNGNTLETYAQEIRSIRIVTNDTLLFDQSNGENVGMIGNVKLNGNFYYKNSVTVEGTLVNLDTLWDDNASRVITINGNLINRGYLGRGPAGWYNQVLITGNIENYNLWRPYETRLTGTSHQYVQQAPGTWFEGYWTLTDTLGDMVLNSPISFRNSQIYGTGGVIRTNGFKLSTLNQELRNLRINSNDTLLLHNSDGESVFFSGNIKLKGKFYYKNYVEFNGILTNLDTLWDDNASRVIKINGDLINKGYLGRGPSGWYNQVQISGNLDNRGTWQPYETLIIGSGIQGIRQDSGTRFENRIVLGDTLGSVTLTSPVLFSGGRLDMNGAKLNTGIHQMNAVNQDIVNGTIETNDTLNFYNCVVENVKMVGLVHLKGKLFYKNYNSVHGKLILLDTLVDNDASYAFTINGSMENYGAFLRGPSKWYSRLNISGDLYNQGTLDPYEIHLTDTHARTINGPMMATVSCIVVFDDSIRLVGDNMINYLRMGSTSNAWCSVEKGARLQLLDDVAENKILNRGTVTVKQEIDTSQSRDYNFFSAEIRNKAHSLSSFLTIDHMGSQQHYTTENAMNDWWRIRNIPQVYTDSLTFLRLHYSVASLNGNLEDSLNVYHSANAGVTWKRIRSAIVIDKTAKTIYIPTAPSYGHYVVSAGPAGSMSFDPVLSYAEPRNGGNSGSVTLYLFGVGFQSNSLVFLRRTGYSDIPADTSYLTSYTGESMLARFNLKSKVPGFYDVCVSTPGKPLMILNGYFEIKPGMRSRPWVLMNGRDRYLVNRWQTFSLSYGNLANTDARGTWILFTISDRVGLQVEFPDWKFVLPSYFKEQGSAYTRIADSVPTYFASDTFSGFEGKRIRVYPVYIPIIPAQSNKMVRVRVKCPTGDLSMNAWLLDSWYSDIDYLGKTEEPMPTEVRACITAAAMKAFANGAIGLIPGAGCYNLVDKVVDPIGYITPESLKPGEPEGVGCLWSFVSWASSITQCATSFMPGLNVATQMGIAVAGMIVDGVDGKNTNEACWAKFRRKSGNKVDSRGVSSFDPNEKVGPAGFASQNYITNSGLKNYRIFFENKNTASAPALEVFIFDTLDKTKFDLSQFSFGSITFSDTTVQVQPFAKAFSLLVDRFPKQNILVQVVGHLDTATGAVYIAFHSLDRISLELTEYDTLGFLPPNKISPEGEGNVSFSLGLKPGLPFGMEVRNKATIIFDFNPPILTNEFRNTLDDQIPVSSVNGLPSVSTDSVFTVSWSGTDQGCGIRHYNVFVSENDSAYTLWLANTSKKQSQFTGNNKRSYKFFCLATDSLGWTEVMKTSAEATTYVNQSGTSLDENSNGLPRMVCYPNPARDIVEVKWTGYFPSMQFQLFNLQGRLILNQAWNASQGTQTKKIDVSGTAPGLYLIRIGGGEETFQQLLILE